ncbi:MAG: ABC transporter permease [Solirubrobacterales bacterium]|nr:ABC transporter permease [Solirubrobacterales bacterium]
MAPNSKARRIGARVLPPVIFALIVLTAWQLYVEWGNVRESTLPPPTAIAESIWDNRTMLAENAWVTIKEILIGFAVAIVIGVGVATLIRSSQKIERAVYPWLVVSQMIPIPAIAPILVIWTGFDMRPKVMVIALVSFFPIAVNTIDGLRAAEPELLNLLKTLKANAWQRFRKAQLPAALPFLFSGLKVAAAFSVIGAVFAEWVGASEGLGYLILVLNNQTATTDMFAVIVVLALIGISLFLIVSLIERLMLPWYYESRQVEAEGLELEPEEVA